jgi:hypothetical protein
MAFHSLRNNLWRPSSDTCDRFDQWPALSFLILLILLLRSPFPSSSSDPLSILLFSSFPLCILLLPILRWCVNTEYDFSSVNVRLKFPCTYFHMLFLWQPALHGVYCEKEKGSIVSIAVVIFYKGEILKKKTVMS